MRFRLIIEKDKEETVTACVHARSALTDELESLVMQYNGADKLVAFTEDEMVRLSFSDIACITVNDGKSYVIDTNGARYRVKQRLYELEERLPASFIRINKSAIANEAQIKEFRASFSGAVDAVFRCGYVEYVSRRCFAAIKRRYQE